MQHSNFPYFIHNSITGTIINSFNWSQSSLGKPEHWPALLKSSLSQLLLSKIPSYLYWGEENIQFYNDALIPEMMALKMHPQALCKPGATVWPKEVWETNVNHLNLIKETKESTLFQDVFVDLETGYYWTISHTPLINENEEVEGVLVHVLDDTAKVKHKKESRNFQQRFSSIANQSTMGILYLTAPDFFVEFANQAYCEMTGETIPNLIGHKIFDVRPLEQNDFEPILKEVIRKKEKHHIENLPFFHHKMQRNGFTNIDYQPIIEDDEVHGVFIICQDVTTQVMATREIENIVTHRTQQLYEANLKLQQSNAELEQFAYIASHDLQEPIRKVISYTQLLEKEIPQSTEKSKNYIGRITYASERMRTLIDDLLKLAQLSLNNNQEDAVDLNQLFKQLLTDFDFQIEEKNVAVSMQHLPIVKGSQSQLQQLFSNLISNALKFMPVGEPGILKIDYALLEAKQLPELKLVDNQYHQVTVTDNGIGFLQEDAHRIFEAFHRLNNKDHYAGTGMGLALCKKIAIQHQGDIYATANPNEGASFHTLLPI